MSFIGTGFTADPGTTGAVFLQQPVGARPFAMGQAYVALGDDVFGLPYNPASLSRLSESQVATQFIQSVGNTQIGYLGIASPLNPENALGFSAAYLDAGKDVFFDSSGNQTGTLTVEQDFLAHLGYAYAFTFGGPAGHDHDSMTLDAGKSEQARSVPGRLHIGVGATVLRSTLAQEMKATAYAGDIGALYEFSLRGGLASIGLSASNMGPGIKYSGGLASGSVSDPLPMTIRAGMGYASQILRTDAISAGVEVDRVAYENSMYEGFGLEYDYHHLVALRLGYRLGQDSGKLTIGAGVNIKNFSLDYGFGLVQTLSNIQQVSLTYRFTVPGIRYGKPYLASAEPVDVMAQRADELIAAGRYFDALADTEKLEAAFPGAIQGPQLREKLRRQADGLLAAAPDAARSRYAMGLKAMEASSWDEAIPNLEANLSNDSSGEIARALKEAKQKRQSQTERKTLERQARIATLFEMANAAYEAHDYARALKTVNTILGFASYQAAESLRFRIEDAMRRELEPARRPAPRDGNRAAPPGKENGLIGPAPKPAPAFNPAAPEPRKAVVTEENAQKADQLYNEAMQHYLEGDLRQTIDALSAAARLNPDNETIRNFLSSVQKASNGRAP